MTTRWSDLSYEGRALRRAFAKVMTKLDKDQYQGVDEMCKLCYCAANLAGKQSRLVEVTHMKSEIDELKSIVYNLPEEMLAQVRSKLGK